MVERWLKREMGVLFDATGQIDRQTFWTMGLLGGFIFYYIVLFAGVVLVTALLLATREQMASALLLVVSLLYCYSLVVIGMKRARSQGNVEWIGLVGLLPYWGWVMWLYFGTVHHRGYSPLGRYFPYCMASVLAVASLWTARAQDFLDRIHLDEGLGGIGATSVELIIDVIGFEGFIGALDLIENL